MSYGAFLGILLTLLLISLIWTLMAKKEQAVFVKRHIKYILYAALLFLVLGSGSGLLRKLIQHLGPLFHLILLQIIFLGLGILHRYKLDTYFNWKEDKFIPLRLAFSLFIATLVAVIFFGAQWIIEWKTKNSSGLSDNRTTSMLIGLVPLFFDWAHRVWNQIPIVTKSLEPYMLPLDRDPPVFEPSTQIIRLIIQVPYRFQAEESIALTVTAPLAQTLGSVFYQVIDEHNIRRRSPRPIEIAEEQKRSKLYGWLFYKTQKAWLGLFTRKVYLPYDQIIKQTGLADRDTIYVERVKTW